MATAKSSESIQSRSYGKLLQRNFSRTLERVKSTLGKTDKTSDDEFDKLAVIFRDQQAVASRLQKGMNAYMFQAQIMAEVTQDLYRAIRDAYEVDWEEGKSFREKAEKVPSINSTHLDTVHERVMPKINIYTAKFSPVKTRMAKRSRKLTDYDAARRRTRSLEGAKKRNEVKIAQARDNLATTKHVYEALNQDLVRELPKLYDSRVVSLCTVFETFLNTEQDYSTKLSTIHKEMTEIVSKMRERAEELAELNRHRNGTSAERQTNNYYANITEMKSHNLSNFSDDAFNTPSRFIDETASGVSDFSTNEIQKYSEEYNENLGGETKEEAQIALASWSPNDDITSSVKHGTAEKSTQHPSRPDVGPSNITPGRPPVNAVGVVADVHKGGKSETLPSASGITPPMTSSATLSSNVGSDSPAVVQQQMMLRKKKQEEEELLKKKREEELTKKKEEFLNGKEVDEIKKKNDEELLKQQMLKQRQQEEYLKQQFEQQQQRQRELKLREQQAILQHEQRMQQKEQLSSTAANAAAVISGQTITTSTANSGTVTNQTVGVQTSANGSTSNEENEETDVKNLEPNVSVVVGSQNAHQSDNKEAHSMTSQKIESENMTSSSAEEKLSEILNEPEKPYEDVILYTVVATREYHGEDSEELNLEPGHVIKVLQRNQHEEALDNGWLYGINTTTKVRGIFQANFTERIDS